MKKLILLVLLLLPITALSQTRGVAYRLRAGTAAARPTKCKATAPYIDVYYATDTETLSTCTATDTWGSPNLTSPTLNVPLINARMLDSGGKWSIGMDVTVETLNLGSARGVSWKSTDAYNGTSDTTLFRSAAGVIGAGTTTSNTLGSFKGIAYLTDTNCADSAGAAACGSATSGSFVIDAATTSTVVSTSSVTANSQIHVQEDSSLNTRLSVTCNTQSSLVLGSPRVTARTPGTSFTVTIEVGPTTNPMCLNYTIIN